MKRKAVLAIDQGTTGTRAILYGRSGRLLTAAYQEFRQYFPKPGWVEHDPEEIWRSTLAVIRKALKKAHLSSNAIVSIGITNQRETTLLWDRYTGKALHRAIVWQDRRTSAACDRLKKKGFENKVRLKTGLVLDPYFSATKIQWMLKHTRGIQQKIRSKRLCFGTVDTWLLWKLTGGRVHATDYTNASRTLLFNIKTKKWDTDLLKLFSVPKTILPKVCPSGGLFGYTSAVGVLRAGIPIHAILGDQQAALFGQGCYRSGSSKNTYGTGCFVVVNCGKRYCKPPHGLLTTLAADEKGLPIYALEGAIFIAGAAIQWLRDGLKFFKSAAQSERFAKKIKDTGGVVVIPAFAGLGSPYWNPHVRGTILGITRGTKREHIIRATLDSLAHQSADVIEEIQKSSPKRIRELRVDGGATGNQYLMQTQADYLKMPVLVSDLPESTAWGVAKLAAKQAGFWPSLKKIDSQRRMRRYRPSVNNDSQEQRKLWKSAVKTILTASNV